MKVCIACNHRFDRPDWQCTKCDYYPPKIAGHLAFAPDLAHASEGFEAHFFERLAELEAGNFWFRSRNRLIIWALQHYFPHTKSCLEIGCGTGFVLSDIEQNFPELQLSASEVFTQGLAFAAQRVSTAQLFQMDARKIPFEDEFGLIGAFDVLEHIQADTEVLAQMYQAIHSEGGIVLTVPQHPWLWSQADDYAHHVRRYRAIELKQKVIAAGFRVVRTTSFVSLLLPLLLASRLSQKRHKSNYDPTSELKIQGWLNDMLENILSWERRLIQSGVSFAAGGSLLLIAKK
ncbi:MAG: class I SAM-dependent methyltransferase [Scytolyngbya sp. HA4215-MV1]|nr:class I SAM-dependent methyltransferase [Scytolyngbya sp. HA4215-MV1]